MKLFRKINNIQLSAAFILVVGLLMFGLPQKVFAIEENTSTIPNFVVRADDPNANMCRTDSSAPIHGHGQDVWLSQRGANWVQTINVTAGTNSVDMMINTLSRHCDSNIDGNGNIINREIQETRSNTVSLSSPEGSIVPVSGAPTAPFPYDVTLDYRPSYFYNQRYVVSGFGPAFQLFRINGLNGLEPGKTHTITVSYKYRLVHRYLKNGQNEFVCVANGAAASGGLTGTNCPETTRTMTINVNIGTSIIITSGGNCDSGNIRGGARIMGDPEPKTVVLQRRDLKTGNFFEVDRQLANKNSTNPNGQYQGYVFDFDTRKYNSTYKEDYRVVILGTAYHDDISFGPCATIECGGYNISSGTPQPGEPFDLTASFSIDDFGTVSRARNLRYDIVLNISSDPAGSYPLAGFPVTSARALAPSEFSRTFEGLTINTTGAFYVRYRIRVWNPWTDGAITDRSVLCAADEGAVAYKPYHKVYGGDVLAGKSRLSGGGCISNPNAKIEGWSNGFEKGYTGAGTQLAAFAVNSINDFASAQFTKVPKGLTFANTDNDEFGGNLSPDAVDCGPDYWTVDGVGSSVPNPINPSHEGAYRNSGDTEVVVNDGGIGTGKIVTVYVEGDAYISNSITYQTTNYADLSSVPQFRLIVKGNIYVGPRVTELNGLFVAIKQQDGSGGKFYTCGSSIGGGRPPSLTMVQAGGPCSNNKLTVYGAVVADQIKFSRSLGTVGDAETHERYNTGGNPAEVFVYTPEVWLRGGGYAGEGDAAAFMTLPPVL